MYTTPFGSNATPFGTPPVLTNTSNADFSSLSAATFRMSPDSRDATNRSPLPPSTCNGEVQPGGQR